MRQLSNIGVTDRVSKKIARFVAAVAVATLPLTHMAEASDLLMIDFNDPNALRSVRWPYSFKTLAREYKENGVLVLPHVSPPDPRLGNVSASAYWLSYEDESIQPCGPDGGPGRMVDGVCQSVDYGAEPRFLQPRATNQTIQLTYEPNGTRERFNLWELTVKSGSLNVGIQYADGSIAVYNNIHAPYRWGFSGADNINRVTLEGVGSNFRVDDITIQPIH